MARKTNVVSRILLGNSVIAASTTSKSKSINVFDGVKQSYIPKTKANIDQLNRKFGKSKVQVYRGQKRNMWLDNDMF
ncbi:MAG: hypothetical protein E7339_00240 [Clostridiales bacterium]|nr:hypothetical protein [Clostridiales bacterium]